MSNIQNLSYAAVARRTAVADAAYTALTSDSLIVYTSLSAARTVTLPAASTYNPGQILMIVDGSGSVTQTISISVAPNGTDTIAGSNTTQVCINIPRGRCWLVSNGSNGWDVLVWSVIYTHVLTGNTSLSNTGQYFDGPSVAQGTVGVWKAWGGVLIHDTAGAAAIISKLWDGTTTVDSKSFSVTASGTNAIYTHSGRFTNPAGNIRISARDLSSTSGLILANSTGQSNDSVITVERVA